uniref:Uncharacterized protein n=1 Tax=viral metagenome TaxID=1070528 RepID=A0A6M3J1F4_9ZZZZ
MDDVHTKALRKILLKNLLLHLILTQEINQTPFGQITVNVKLKNGVAQIETINIVKNRRKKYYLAKKEEVTT